MKEYAGELTVLALFAAVVVWRAVEGRELTWSLVVFGSLVLAWGGRAVGTRYGLPAWSPKEAYITRLRRWRRDRQEGPASSRAPRPS
jgi:hypothetical protein